MVESGRDKKLDFLRFMGLAMIVLAHVGPPQFIFQLRNFDVPLMVLVAGISFGLSSRSESYGSYLWKRFNRLVFPVWIFLTGYFLVHYFLPEQQNVPSVETIVSSYFFIGDYVWIIRVFLLVAVVAPYISTINVKTQSHARYLAMVFGIYLLYELMLTVAQPILNTALGSTVDLTLFVLLPYGVLFALALRIPVLSARQVSALALCAFAVFVAIGTTLYLQTGNFVPTQMFKYPPTAYYLSFALMVSLLLYLFSGRLVQWVALTKLEKPVEFMAKNSIWVYLWHIPMLELVSPNWYFFVKYPLVLGVALLVAFLQVSIVERWLIKIANKPATKKTLRTWLTG